MCGRGSSYRIDRCYNASITLNGLGSNELAHWLMFQIPITVLSVVAQNIQVRQGKCAEPNRRLPRVFCITKCFCSSWKLVKKCSKWPCQSIFALMMVYLPKRTIFQILRSIPYSHTTKLLICTVYFEFSILLSHCQFVAKGTYWSARKSCGDITSEWRRLSQPMT